MSNKDKALAERAAHEIEVERFIEQFRVGDEYIDTDGDVIRIVSIETKADARESKIRWIDYDGEDAGWDTEHIHSWDWSSFSSSFKRLLKLDAPIETVRQQALAEFNNIKPFEELLNESGEETKDIVATNSRRAYDARKVVEARKRRVEIITRVAQGQLKRFENMRSALLSQLKNINKVIEVIELYLGVYESIVQIREGQPAAPNTPITIRQLVLYMDEECGDPRVNPKTGQPGIDFQNVEDFDKWLLAGGKKLPNLNKLLPEPRGIIAINPSRQNRSYSDNAWINAMMSDENRMTYFLIRNGEQVFRIWTSVAIKGAKLFPSETEISERRARAGKYANEWWGSDDAEHAYKKNIAIIQGLLDRTPVFTPLAHPVNLFDLDTYGDLVSLIYDGDLDSQIGDGRETYSEWKKRINTEIKVGSRILLTRSSDYEHNRRLTRYYSNDSFAPPAPKAGIYVVEGIGDLGYFSKEEALVIYYNPRDTIYSTGWAWSEPHERKNRVGFRILRSDSFVLNYDGIDLADVERLIQDRLGRRDYLSMMPALWGIREARLKEIEYEREFVRLVAARNAVTEDAVWDAVSWWKTKNKWKRGLDQDDALAMRMIEKRVGNFARTGE